MDIDLWQTRVEVRKREVQAGFHKQVQPSIGDVSDPPPALRSAPRLVPLENAHILFDQNDVVGTELNENAFFRLPQSVSRAFCHDC